MSTPATAATRAGTTFLQKNPNPTEDEIKDALAGHLCRCSAYAGIIKTVKDTAAYMRGEATL
jgi:aerobic-type carbon monoxide dehydrogenase small subunit (CoxS/CutS family)